VRGTREHRHTVRLAETEGKKNRGREKRVCVCVCVPERENR